MLLPGFIVPKEVGVPILSVTSRDLEQPEDLLSACGLWWSWGAQPHIYSTTVSWGPIFFPGIFPFGSMVVKLEESRSYNIFS